VNTSKMLHLSEKNQLGQEVCKCRDRTGNCEMTYRQKHYHDLQAELARPDLTQDQRIQLLKMLTATLKLLRKKGNRRKAPEVSAAQAKPYPFAQ